jgi:hypothetical protein
MDVYATNTSAPGGSIYFDAHSGGSIMSRVYGSNFASGTVTSDFGLVTEFSTSTSTSVPEPATMLLLGLGLIGLAGVRRKFKK